MVLYYLIPIARSGYRGDGGGYGVFGTHKVELTVQFATHQESNEHMDSTHEKKYSDTISAQMKMSLQDCS